MAAPEPKDTRFWETLIIPEHIWCIECMRSAFHAYDPTEDAPFTIGCRWNAIQSSRCRPCADGGKSCDGVSKS